MAKKTIFTCTHFVREPDKAHIKGDPLAVEIVQLIPPAMTQPGASETEVWKLVDGGKKLKTERHIKFVTPGISIEEKKASELLRAYKLPQFKLILTSLSSPIASVCE